jgi:hypothetical protein
MTSRSFPLPGKDGNPDGVRPHMCIGAAKFDNGVAERQ